MRNHFRLGNGARGTQTQDSHVWREGEVSQKVTLKGGGLHKMITDYVDKKRVLIL